MSLVAMKRNKETRSHNFFNGDIASPFALGSAAASSPSPNPYPIAGGSRIGISFSTVLTEGQLTINLNGRTISVPALSADAVHRLETFPAGRTVIPTCAIAGTVKFFVLDQWMRPQEIATGTFT